MKIRGKEINLKFFLWFYCFNGLIILDMFLITIALIFHMPQDIVTDIQYFDLFVCIILLCEYALNLHMSSPKKDFIMDPMNMLGLIASIPFDFILVVAIPGSGVLRYLRLLKLSRVFLLSSRLQFVKDLCQKTGLHKIMGALAATIVVFTLLFYFFGSSYSGFDDFYFVVVTLTTVGYGDVVPKTYNERVLALILIIIGILVFSSITAAMSSYLTDRLVKTEEDEMEDELNDVIERKTGDIMNELKTVREENKGLKDEVGELKDEILQLKELIKNK